MPEHTESAESSAAHTREWLEHWRLFGTFDITEPGRYEFFIRDGMVCGIRPVEQHDDESLGRLVVDGSTAPGDHTALTTT